MTYQKEYPWHYQWNQEAWAKQKQFSSPFYHGITTGIGAFFGAILGGISQSLISLCLAFAAGAMLYIVSGELIPESKKLYKGRLASIGNIAGFILGIIAMQYWKKATNNI